MESVLNERSCMLLFEHCRGAQHKCTDIIVNRELCQPPIIFTYIMFKHVTRVGVSACLCVNINSLLFLVVYFCIYIYFSFVPIYK